MASRQYWRDSWGLAIHLNEGSSQLIVPRSLQGPMVFYGLGRDSYRGSVQPGKPAVRPLTRDLMTVCLDKFLHISKPLLCLLRKGNSIGVLEDHLLGSM